MRRLLFVIVPLLLMHLLCQRLGAQSIDPTLAAMIVLYTEKAENSLRTEQEAMLLESSGHIWVKSEVEGVRKLDEEFNEYLDTFHGIIVYAAQIYGFYHEIDRLAENTGKLADRIAQSPGNALAVALSANRNKVCLSDVKMTEKERTEIVFGVRPKLKGMNKKLERLIRAVKYTTLTDVWNEVSGHQPDKADIEGISTEAFRRWKTIGKTVRP